MGQKSSSPVEKPTQPVPVDYNPFDAVPIEVLVQILKCLPLTSVKDARNACSKWRNTFDEPKFDLLKFSVILDPNSTQKWVFGKANSLQTESAGNSITFWAAQWSPEEADDKGMKFGSVLIGLISPGNSVCTLMNFFREGCENLEFLQIKCLALSSLSVTGLAHVLPKVKWSKLTQLDIVAEITEQNSESQNHYKAVAGFLKLVKIPELQMLKLRFGSGSQAADQTIPMIPSLNDFVERHASTLKLIDLNSIDSNLRKTPMSLNHGQTSCTELEHLALGGSLYLIIDQLSPSLWKSDKLRTLIWSPNPTIGPAPVWGSCTTIRALINKSQQTLVKAKIGFTDPKDISQFDLSWLRNCNALKDLELGSISNVGNARIYLPGVTTLYLHLDSPIVLQDKNHWVIQSFPNVRILKLKVNAENELNSDWCVSILKSWPGIQRVSQVGDSCTKFYNVVPKSGCGCAEKELVLTTVFSLD